MSFICLTSQAWKSSGSSDDLVLWHCRPIRACLGCSQSVSFSFSFSLLFLPFFLSLFLSFFSFQLFILGSDKLLYNLCSLRSVLSFFGAVAYAASCHRLFSSLRWPDCILILDPVPFFLLAIFASIWVHRSSVSDEFACSARG